MKKFLCLSFFIVLITSCKKEKASPTVEVVYEVESRTNSVINVRYGVPADSIAAGYALNYDWTVTGQGTFTKMETFTHSSSQTELNATCLESADWTLRIKTMDGRILNEASPKQYINGQGPYYYAKSNVSSLK